MPDLERERVDAARMALRRFSTAESREPGAAWVPAWSSSVLEKSVEDVVSRPDARISDLFRALWELSGEERPPLTKAMANFIHDIVVLCFTRYRSRYEADDFAWMADGMRAGVNAVQAYLALLALPEGLAVANRDAVLAALEGTEFFDEAQRML